MKKLLLLFLLVAGGVSTASAKIIYLQNNWGKTNIWVGYGSTTDDGKNSWSALFSIGQWDSKDVYTVDLGESTYFKITYTGGETSYLTSSSFVEGKCYYFDGSGLGGPFDITVHTYSFTVDTDPNHDFGTLKLHLFKDASPINGAWGSNPAMVKDGNVYSYTYRSIPNSGGIGVVFHNDTDADRTDDMGASEGANNYVLMYNSSATNKIRKAEKVTTNSSGYCTYVNSEALSISGPTAYYATDNGDGNATAHAITNPAASTPMLIKGTTSTSYYFEVAASGTDYSSTNAFKAGSGSGVDGGSGPYNYILKGDAFYLANGNTVAANKAYLQLTVAATARPLIFADEDVTGIEAVENMNNDTYYNLQGVKVAQPTKGLYIINGRKVVIK